MKEIKGNSQCPCRSGLRYSTCCKKKKLKWVVDAEGSLHKQVPLVPEAVQLLNEAKEAFCRIFERDPRGNDPIMLVKYLLSDAEIERQSIAAMEAAGFRPELIYAYRKTGLIITVQNEGLATTTDIEEWDEAIDEYLLLQETPPEPDPVQVAFSDLEGELDSIIICLGYVLEHGILEESTRTASSSVYFTVDDYVLLCATKSIKTLRAVKALISENIGSDCLSLARHIYENYLHCIFSINKPEMMEHLVDAVIGLKRGTHEYAKNKNGRTDGRRIIRLSDGKEFLGQISNYKMVESSRYDSDMELFDYIYSFLSDYTHPSFDNLRLVISDKDFLDPLSNELKGEAIFFSICFSSMILDQLTFLPSFSELAKRDIRVVLLRISNKIDALLQEMYGDNEMPPHFSLLRERISVLGNNQKTSKTEQQLLATA